MWALYEEYSAELKKLVQEDWVSFRGSLHQLEDLMISWSEKMRNEIKAQGEPTPMIVKIQKEVSYLLYHLDDSSNLYSYIKLCFWNCYF